MIPRLAVPAGCPARVCSWSGDATVSIDAGTTFRIRLQCLWRARYIESLTNGGTRYTTPEGVDHYNIFPTQPMSGWQGDASPIIRRLHRHEEKSIEAHLLRLNEADRRQRLFRETGDLQIRTHVCRIDWNRSVIFGAFKTERLVGVAELLFDAKTPPAHAEIAVSTDRDWRGQGLGYCLVSRALDVAMLRGAPHAKLPTLQDNPRMQRIIGALGGHIDLIDLIGVIPTCDAAH